MTNDDAIRILEALTRLEDRQHEMLTQLTQLNSGPPRLNSGLSQLESGITTLHVELVARLDRLQATVNSIRDLIGRA